MSIYVNDGGTLRTLRFLAINDSGTIRRVNEVYVNDGSSLEGPFSAVHTTARTTNTETTYVSGDQSTSYSTTSTFNTNRDTTTIFDTTRDTTTTFNTVSPCV